jgi:phosphatidylglycerol:prolipoprotein diacylglycerol transferase
VWDRSASDDDVGPVEQAMIPFLEQPVFSVGPLTIATFGLLVSASVFVGLTLGRWRFQRLGLDARLGDRLGWWVLLGGFAGAHLFSVLLYFPDKVAANPLVLFKVWEDISSFGGLVGGALALWWFLRRHGSALTQRERWAYVDAVAFVFPIALMVGRLACTAAHDHPGTVTGFPLAVSLATPDARGFIADVYADAGRLQELPSDAALAALGFHDLGWYEFLYLAAVVVPVLWWSVGRTAGRARHAGVPRTLISFILLYMPVRFLLDFLRVSDVRYVGLTPAQWAALAAMGALPFLWRVGRRDADDPPAAAHIAEASEPT